MWTPRFGNSFLSAFQIGCFHMSGLFVQTVSLLALPLGIASQHLPGNGWESRKRGP